MPLSQATIQALFPRAPTAHLEAFAAQHDALFARFEITNGNRLNFFLAQIGHESGGLTIEEENLNYRADRLCAVWPSRFPTLADAQACAGSPEGLANTVYANRMGNGGAASGDGWRYRGRGYIQITGRDGYAQVGAIAGATLALVEHPERA